MDVILAGYTLDAEIVRQLKTGSHDSSDNITPESISAAYARISRDPAPVTELRARAREEIAEARKSNRSIVFGMGHHSVAEHVKLNFDILGLSRLAVEVLEHHRLCSYTEKSQRYITLDGDYIEPKELMQNEAEKFHQLVKRQNEFYFAALPKLIEYQRETHPEMAREADKKKEKGVDDKMNREKNTLEGWAKEDARYSLSLATETQLGFSANARNLEYAIRRFKYHELLEVRELGAMLYHEAKTLIPSLIILADKDEFFRTQKATLDDNFLEHGQKDMLEATRHLLQEIKFQPWDRFDAGSRAVELLYADNVDERIITSLIKKKGGLTQREARAVYYAMTEERKLEYLLDCLQNLGEHDALPREFEKGSFTYQLMISSSCFAQLKRHRMATISDCRYAPDLSITVPESVKAVGLEGELGRIAEASADLYREIKAEPEIEEGPDYSAADYCLTNAHRRIVEMELNLRDLYHFSRLREDAHAQWDIREKAHQMVWLARKAAPLTTLLIGGKDQFAEIRKRLYQ